METYPSARDRPAAFADKEIEAGDPEGSSMQIDAARRTSRDGRSQERFSNTFLARSGRPGVAYGNQFTKTQARVTYGVWIRVVRLSLAVDAVGQLERGFVKAV